MPLPIRIQAAYWTEVRRLLQTKHHLNRTEASSAVREYMAVLDRRKIGEIIYHSPVAETARGIVQGEYGRQKSQHTAKA